MAEHSFLKSSFPVLLISYCQTDLPTTPKTHEDAGQATDDVDAAASEGQSHKPHPFMEALQSYGQESHRLGGRMRTNNGDVAFSKSGEPLVDLFYELEDGLDPGLLQNTLVNAWKADPDLTLKIIWNARSIHLGKSSRRTFYCAIDWLKQTHPRTLLDNLPWLVRPVIRKKVPKKDMTKKETDDKDGEAADKMEIDSDSDFELLDADDEAEARAEKRVKLDGPYAESDVKHGMAHGYWKDLLNILVLAANDQLSEDGNIGNVLQSKPKSKRQRDWTAGQRNDRLEQQHKKITAKLMEDTFYRALHMRVAKLFADQLSLDIQRLRSGTKADLKRITLAAKWAPSNKGSHDQQTFIVSTIAELLYPVEAVQADGTDRELYLRHARCAYQSKILSPLRKHLDVVERHITAKTFDQIKYDRLPSLALKMHRKVFQEKDEKHFRQYVMDVTQGKAKISGAVLLPSTMVSEARKSLFGRIDGVDQQPNTDLEAMVADGQWNTLIQRIRDSGTMESAIAICDVSGSMEIARSREDSSTAMDAAIGLSLVLAEVCEPPFGRAFITFDNDPAVVQLEDDKLGRPRTFYEKVQHVESSPWGGSTNFQAVFEKLILPMAKKHELKQEDMVKRVFVFSDMQFNKACCPGEKWSSSFERIKNAYATAGYEMPELVFWNLGSATYGTQRGVVPKPVDAKEPGTALVSGYSQAMMKTFMDGGDLDQVNAPDCFEADAITLDADGNEIKVKGAKMTPLDVVQKAVGHDAYRMLQVVD